MSEIQNCPTCNAPSIVKRDRKTGLITLVAYPDAKRVKKIVQLDQLIKINKDKIEQLRTENTLLRKEVAS